ncbi:MAG: rod shape-determining protein MreC [Bacteroidota bacterium]
MLRLFDIIRFFKEYFIFTLLVLISFWLLSINDNTQVRAIRSYTVGAIGLLQNAFSAIPNVFQLREENRILRELNVNLTDEVSRLREARLENVRLRSLLNLRDRSPFHLLPADIVGKNLQLMRNTLTLDVGDADSVKPDMAVISHAGLVGRVIAISSHYAICQIVPNKDFRASGVIQRSRVDCIVTWNGGTSVHLKNISKKQDVKIGDVVVTSGYSILYPRDIVIGTVINVVEAPGSLFKDVEATPTTDFATLEQVFVIMETPNPERLELEQKASGTR